MILVSFPRSLMLTYYMKKADEKMQTSSSENNESDKTIMAETSKNWYTRQF